MCFPKAPKQDPQIAIDQAAARQRELDRLSEEKKKDVVARRRVLRGAGQRSLLTAGNTGAGFGENYTA